ncbi:MFS transporter [Aureibaculum algae]|uniref:MFS transporter n=1 Tax=Aureibaculum algae TaxID=2584122 RepID=A0A5B7TX80_9FLAO|nr:MFS transporter [Aureibaculum algae]QCX39059.1 MFS transporter [Aureibaculum algae]QCX39894.1 MFS transporter [Aureibaculum algae]
MKNKSIYTFDFGLICLSSLLFSSSYNMLIPELPTYLESLGGKKYIGLIIALFTLTAGVSRPFSGKLTDTIGRKPVMLIGIIVCIICGFLYPILTTVYGFLLLRFLHGFSTGFSPTAFAAFLTDIIPSNRWGEALGIQSLFFSSGLALGPVLGSFIKLHQSYNFLFYCSSFISLLSILCIINLKETLVDKRNFQISFLRIKKNDIIDVKVIYPAIITFISYLSFGIVLTLIPLLSNYLGIMNKGLFFIIFTLASLLIRFVAGKLSDKYSRQLIIIMGLIFLSISFLILGFYQTKNGLVVGACIYGIAIGILAPTLNAWTVDLCNPKEKGKAIATMFIALEIGIGLGALGSGWYYQNGISEVFIVFYFYAIITFSSLVYMLFTYKKG